VSRPNQIHVSRFTFQVLIALSPQTKYHFASMSTASAPTVETGPVAASASRAPRITSIDALRGFVMFTMIFVNDLAGVPSKIVPPWMRHYHGKSGMTFVDLVFPAFLFIVGMSIPFALGSRLKRGEPLWRTPLHIVVRMLSLLLIGILMVNETPDTAQLGWSGSLWSTLMFLCAILAFCTLSSPCQSKTDGGAQRTGHIVSAVLRCVGLAGLILLAFVFRGENGRRIITLAPFSIHTSWYGILGLIGWAYLVSALIFLVFHDRRTALLGCMVLLFCLYPADRKGTFEGFWLANYVGIGEMLGSHAAITLAGVLLASTLLAQDTATPAVRTRFTLWFIAGCAAGALLLHRLYGINKNNATPSWCLWACATTAALWLLFYFLADVSPESTQAALAKPFAVAGQNVLLAYLISEMLPSTLEWLHLGDWYGSLAEPTLGFAITRSAGCGAAVLALTVVLNRIGFRLKL
jgi:predicted acyltransferase